MPLVFGAGHNSQLERVTGLEWTRHHHEVGIHGNETTLCVDGEICIIIISGLSVNLTESLGPNGIFLSNEDTHLTGPLTSVCQM